MLERSPDKRLPNVDIRPSFEHSDKDTQCKNSSANTRTYLLASRASSFEVKVSSESVSRSALPGGYIQTFAASGTVLCLMTARLGALATNRKIEK
ncbi:hypothetical protein TYRP_002264 [Tyrophagus putrescentiae]|nr:hypothetical protein TYRP_002264 [Tyrophagus putrescentiae]